VTKMLDTINTCKKVYGNDSCEKEILDSEL
jgi:hypothetical protein